jgi:FkbM family methyltransferase
MPVRFPFEIELATGPFRFETAADVRTFWLIFFAGTYEVRTTDRVIIDAGANIGAFSLYALLAAPNASVIAIEPAPDSCDRIRRLIHSHGFEHRYTLHEAALGSRAGMTTLNMRAGSQFRATGSGGIQVLMLTLDELATKEIDLLKMDIEGAEYQTLAATSVEALRNIQRITLEYHPNGALSDCALERAGFVAAMARDDGNGYGIAHLVRSPHPA